MNTQTLYNAVNCNYFISKFDIENGLNIKLDNLVNSRKISENLSIDEYDVQCYDGLVRISVANGDFQNWSPETIGYAKAIINDLYTIIF